MIKEAFLICALSLPSASEHQPAFIQLFDMLVDYAWKRAEIRIGERERRTAILVGQDAVIEDNMKRDGWQILEPPYFPSSTSLIIHLPPLGGNLEGVDGAIAGLRMLLIPGGFFVVSHFNFEDFMPNAVGEDVVDLIMRGFHHTQFTVRLNGRIYEIWRKKLRPLRNEPMGRAA